MTGPAPAGPPARDDLTPRLFRALSRGFDLHHIGGTYVVLPKGTPLSGPSLGAIARQISAPDPAPGPDTAGPVR